MLTKRQNLMETIKGGKPDRFVNQYEFLEIILEAPLTINPKRGETVTNEWGITQLSGIELRGEITVYLTDFITK